LELFSSTKKANLPTKTRKGNGSVPVLDAATGLHNLKLSSNIGDSALDDVVEIHHWRLADELRMGN